MAKQIRFFELEKDERILRLNKNISGKTELYDIYITFNEVAPGTFSYVLSINKKGVSGAIPDQYILLGKIPPDTGAFTEFHEIG
jgi:hypothetical protein